jgi:hypothetical protein
LAENVEKEIQLTISDFRPCELLVLQGAWCQETIAPIGAKILPKLMD